MWQYLPYSNAPQMKHVPTFYVPKVDNERRNDSKAKQRS